MHLGFEAASAMVSTRSSSERTAEVFRRPQRLVARDRIRRDRLPLLGVLGGRYDDIGPSFGNGIMALSGVGRALGGDTSFVLIGGNLGQ
jgi:hypothetical protein